MKRFTEQELTNIRANINNGIYYCGIKNGFGTGFIYKTIYGSIGWIHFGESANANTNRGLRFVVEKIFNECDTITPCQWSDYYINYVPVDKQYKGIDMSARHPNVYGL